MNLVHSRPHGRLNRNWLAKPGLSFTNLVVVVSVAPFVLSSLSNWFSQSLYAPEFGVSARCVSVFAKKTLGNYFVQCVPEFPLTGITLEHNGQS